MKILRVRLHTTATELQLKYCLKYSKVRLYT
jgi:hypothetical protein